MKNDSRRRVAPSAARRTPVGDLALAALRRRPSQQRGVRRVADVLDACERLLVRRRFEDLTIEEIAASARIRMGSLYHFFPDKSAVLVTVLERALADEAAAFELAEDDRTVDLTEYLRRLEERMSRVWRESGLLELYFAFQRHPLVWKLVLVHRARTAEQIGRKLCALDPRLSRAEARRKGSMISALMGVLIDNLMYLRAEERATFRAETYAMVAAYTALSGDARALRRRR